MMAQPDNEAQPPVIGVVASPNPIAYTTYQSDATTAPIPAATQPHAAFSSPHHIAYQQAPHVHNQQREEQNQQLQMFWANQMQDIEDTNDFKNHNLPLARIKKIMKADEDVRMISAEAPVVFAKACEMFISELTLRSWIHTEENKRRTLQKNDIAAAISRTDVFDFLVDIIPRDELKEEGLGVAKASIQVMGPSADSMPYFYPGVMDHQAALYAAAAAQHGRPPMPYMLWPQTQPSEKEPPEM